eukprot:gene560-705_t
MKYILLVTLVFNLIFVVELVRSSAPLYSIGCKKLTKSAIYPDQIEKVRPIDVKVVMALGDSITAAFGLTFKKFGDFIGESRGKSWLIGGEKTHPTIPVFLNLIGANTTGQSYGNTIPYIHFLPKGVRKSARDVKSCQLNAAESQGGIVDIDEQIEYLQKTFKDIPNADFNKDWKMISLFIGLNDICDVCNKKPNSKPEYWRERYPQILRTLKNSFPRTIVNSILLPDISYFGSVGKGESCKVIRDTLSFCECANTEEGKRVMFERRNQLNKIIRESVDQINSENSQVFGAVVQPALENCHIERKFLSNFDCFHLNEFGGKVAAVGIWNNMMTTDPSKKLSTVNPDSLPICPDDSTYLFKRTSMK